MDENTIYRELIDLIKTELAEPYEYDGETSQKVLFTIYGAVMLAEILIRN